MVDDNVFLILTILLSDPNVDDHTVLMVWSTTTSSRSRLLETELLAGRPLLQEVFESPILNPWNIAGA
jgi:hypothetical protein